MIFPSKPKDLIRCLASHLHDCSHRSPVIWRTWASGGVFLSCEKDGKSCGERWMPLDVRLWTFFSGLFFPWASGRSLHRLSGCATRNACYYEKAHCKECAVFSSQQITKVRGTVIRGVYIRIWIKHHLAPPSRAYVQFCGHTTIFVSVIPNWVEILLHLVAHTSDIEWFFSPHR